MSEKIGEFSFQKLTILPPLQGYRNVQLSGNDFKQSQDLSTFSSIQILNISCNNLNNLWKLPPNIINLNIANNMIDDVKCKKQKQYISFKKKESDLPITIEEINFSTNYLKSIEAFLKLQNLELLFLKNNRITSISQLSNLPNLKEVDIEANMINNISDITQFEGHENIQVINIAGNDVASSLSNIKISNLQNVDVVHYYLSRSVQAYQQSQICIRKQESMEIDIDFLQEQPMKFDFNYIKQQSQHQIIQKPKSLSPMTINKHPSAHLQFYQPQKNTHFKTFQEVFKTSTSPKGSTSPLTLLKKVQNTKQNDTDTSAQKKQNSMLIQQKYKLEQQVQFLIKQNETFYTEIQGYQRQIERILMFIDPDDSLNLSQNSKGDLSIRALLDSLEAKIQCMVNQPSLSNQMFGTAQIRKELIKELDLHAMNKFNHKVLNVEKRLEKIQEFIIQNQNKKLSKSKVPILKLTSIGMVQENQEKEKGYSLTSRHEKHCSESTNIQKSQQQSTTGNLFIKGAYKTYEVNGKKNNNSLQQQIDSIKSKIKNYQESQPNFQINE